MDGKESHRAGSEPFTSFSSSSSFHSLPTKIFAFKDTIASHSSWALTEPKKQLLSLDYGIRRKKLHGEKLNHR